MKLKHLIPAFALTGILGLGLAVGLQTNKEVEEVAAATEETTFYIDANSSIWGSGHYSDSHVYMWGAGKAYLWAGGADDGKGGLTSVTVNSKEYWSFSMADRSYTSFIVYCWDMSSSGNQTVDLSFADFQPGQNLITIDPNDKWNVKNTVTFGTLDVGSTVTVTKYGVFDGVKASESIGEDSVASGDSYAVPARINKTGYHFGGWYTDEACSISYSATTISADMNLYAKYTTLVADSYIYYVTGSETATTNYIYSFGGDYQFGGWKETKVVDVADVAEVHGVLSFNGTSQLIYKIPYSTTAGDTHIIINSDSAQSADMPLSAGCAYWFSAGQDGTDAAMGDALDLLLAAEAKRNAVTASGNILAYSICGISVADCASLYNTYYGLSGAAKGYVDATTTYTYSGAYDGETVPTQTGVSYADIMTELRARALEGGQTVSGALKIGSSNGDTTMMAVLASIAAIGVVAFGGLIYFSRKNKRASN